jgi:hypothetical protein
MGAIYAADLWCDDCATKIREEICQDWWDEWEYAVCPDGTEVREFSSCKALYDYLCGMDERSYDSGEFPKYHDDDSESDCPQHCAGGPYCESPTVLNDGTKIGHFFGNDLTAYGAEYVIDAVREDRGFNGVASQVWLEYYDWLDYGHEDQCATCGDWAELNDDDECEYCADLDVCSGDDYRLPFTD